MSLIGPAAVIAGILAILAVMYASHVAEKKRVEELKKLADELGFEFFPNGDFALQQALKSFHLFSQGSSRRLYNLLRGSTGDLEVAIFDYSYVTGSGKHRHTWNHSVVGFRFVGSALPAFSLRPENFGHRIGAWLGYQDIDIETNPDFSSKYLLRGNEEAAIRQLFSPKVCQFFEQKTGISTEGAGNLLVVYRHAKRVKPDEIRGLMEEGFGVLGQFRDKA